MKRLLRAIVVEFVRTLAFAVGQLFFIIAAVVVVGGAVTVIGLRLVNGVGEAIDASGLPLERWSRALPETLEVDRLVQTSSAMSGCGGAILQLSPGFRARLAAEGIGALRGSTTARGFNRYYEPWRETPVPSRWTSEGAWPGLGCMVAPDFDIRVIVSVAREPGSYFTTMGNRDIVVIPSRGWAVYTYFN